MPFMESWDTPRVRFRAPNTNGVFATFRFAAGASAVRRDLFLSLGGFRPELVVQGEETDFCLRLLARGFVVRLGTADPLLHLRLPPDDLAAKAMYGARNELLYAWRNVPMPYLPVRLTKVVARALMVGASSRHPLSAISGLWQGFKRTVGAPDQRRPVERGVYRLAHELKKREAIPFEEIEPQLRSATD
jgi:hypothetical protein